MSEEYHDPRIRTVKLDEIDPKEVIVVMEACAGAMGDSGAFELYSIQNGEVLYFYGNAHYGDLDLTYGFPHHTYLGFDSIFSSFDILHR